jgi:hypothetical protein
MSVVPTDEPTGRDGRDTIIQPRRLGYYENQPMPIHHCYRRFLLGCSLLLAVPSLAAPVTITGRTAMVETARYRVTVEGLCLTRIENRLTGELYAAPPAAPVPDSPAQAALAMRQGVAIDSMRPGVPVRYYGLCERTTVTTSVTPTGAQLVYTGLQSGEGENADFAPAMQIVLMLAVEAATGDLVITPTVRGNIEPVIGVQDRGVYRDGIQVRHLQDNLRLVLPADRGVAYTRETAPAAWRTRPATWLWPQQWEAALLIAEGAKGCLGIWADEPALRYSRLLSLAHGVEHWQAALEFETMEMNYRCTEVTGASWRLNVFAGSWLKAAERYRAQMQTQWPELKPLAERTPTWADRIRVVMGLWLPDAATTERLLAPLPRDSAAVLAINGWKDPNGSTLVPPRKDPLWPPVLLWTPGGAKELPERVAALEGNGIHVFPYANHHLIPGSSKVHPYGAEDWHANPSPAWWYLPTWRYWARFFPEACRDLVTKTGASGICEGYSWVMRRHLGHEAPGENWFTGSVGMGKYFGHLLPQTALMGEQTNEITCRRQQLALANSRAPQFAHPIGGYLFGAFTRQWSPSAQPEVQAADDIRGFLTYWPTDWEALPPAAQAMLHTRGTLFAREGLVSIWPEKWEPRVFHYYKGKDGTEYRLLRDRGTRFVKVVGTTEETLYWRISGVREAATPGFTITGWVGYDGPRAIGLNPAMTYLTQANAPPPAATICALPAGTTLTRCLNGDGYWVASIGFEHPVEKAAAYTVRVRGAKVLFAGVEAVKALPNEEYEVTVTLPGAFAAYWKAPAALKLGGGLTPLPAQLMLYRGAGVESSRGTIVRKGTALQPPCGTPELGEEGALTWLVTLPEEPQYLVFQFGSGIPAGDGAHYSVRVNGRTLWERDREELAATFEERKTNTPVKPKTGAVDLEAYVGQPVVLELAAHGRKSGDGDVISWDAPVLRDVAPKDAELNGSRAVKLEEPEGPE